MIIRKKQLLLITGLLGVLFICTVALSVYLFHREKKPTKNVQQDDSQQSSKICLNVEEYQKLVQNQQQQRGNTSGPISNHHISTGERDYRVLQDPLYPPLNRTDSATFRTLQAQQSQRQETSVRNVNDTYRLVGYLINQDTTNQDSGGNNWKLLARMKDRNTADFYMIPANKNYDIKIQITNDMVVGERLRDIYTIPNSITFDSPLLNKSPYEYVEIDKSDLSFTNGGMFM